MVRDLPLISLIMPVRNEGKYIRETLDSILNNNYPTDQLEIIIVDGLSSDATREIVKSYMDSYPMLKLLDNSRLITPVALNIGVKAAQGDIIVILGGHSYVEKDFLTQSVKALLDHPEADCVGGIRASVGTGLIGESIATVLCSPFGSGGARFRAGGYNGFVDTVASGAYQKKIFGKIGLFDERLVRNQDIEFNSRLGRHGGKIYLTPAIKVFYHSRSSLSQFWRQNFANGLWNIYTTKIVPGSLSIRHYVPFAFVLSLLVSGGLALFTGIGKILLGLIGGSYLFGALLASAKIGMRKGVKYVPVLPLVFFVLHFSYGVGSLCGLLTVWRFNANKKQE